VAARKCQINKDPAVCCFCYNGQQSFRLGKGQVRSPTRLNSGSNAFLLYINDLPGSINNLSNLSKLTLFADYTNLIFTHPNPMELEKDINELFEKIIIWFQTNLLSLNLNKTYYMQFLSKTNYEINVNVSHKTIQISNVCHTNFLVCNFIFQLDAQFLY